MLCGAAVLLILSSAAPDPDGRGTDLDPAGPASARKRVRAGASVAAAAAFSTTFDQTNYQGPKVGLGFALDLGLVLGDQVLLFVHLEGNTLPPLFLMYGAGLGVEVFLTDRFSLGTGTNFGVQFGGSHLLGFSFPLRASFFPTSRAPTARARTGLLLGFQAGPVLSLYGYPSLAVAASVTVGYGWW